MDTVLKVTKVLVGVAVGIVAAEGVAIASNAALDDIEDIANSFRKKEPPKKRGLFSRKKKGGN